MHQSKPVKSGTDSMEMTWDRTKREADLGRIRLVVTSTEQRSGSCYQTLSASLSLSMFGAQGDEKQSVFIREEPFCTFVRPAGLI